MVAIHIGKGRKQANRWFHGGPRAGNYQTGECGLEGLSMAARYIRDFGNNFMGRRSELQIGWADSKRMRAYKYLLRYEGFTMYTHEDGSPKCIAFRNPKYYEWIPNEEVKTDV
jgi:hypothetical protein